jgi:predicted nucleic acid-binding protein
VRAVVADTTPLHYLVLIQAIDLLPQLFAAVHVPEEVRAELLDAGAQLSVREWAAALPAWITVHAAPQVHNDALLESLDDGERASIALAGILQPDLLLIDERAGVAVAEAKGFAVMGTLGVLSRAANLGLINLPTAFAALQATNFHVRQALLDRLLAEDRERRRPSWARRPKTFWRAKALSLRNL